MVLPPVKNGPTKEEKWTHSKVDRFKDMMKDFRI
jgi:hypothetical protein